MGNSSALKSVLVIGGLAVGGYFLFKEVLQPWVKGGHPVHPGQTIGVIFQWRNKGVETISVDFRLVVKGEEGGWYNTEPVAPGEESEEIDLVWGSVPHDWVGDKLDVVLEAKLPGGDEEVVWEKKEYFIVEEV